MAQESTATVTAITGRAMARNSDGELRVLRVGDTLREGESVVTPDGGSVELALADGSPLGVPGATEMAITGDLLAETAVGVDESALQDETVQQVLTALDSGEDLGDVVPATAAGDAGQNSGSGLDGEGHSYVRLSRITEEYSEFSGIEGSAAAVAEFAVDENFIPLDAVDDFATTEVDVPVTVDVLPNDDFQLGATVVSVTNG
ncbi:MAG: retention module-containing protein, partial [Halieaceae bacterium]|nr:retention module-containing protein [Halieaceae bacterium]